MTEPLFVFHGIEKSYAEVEILRKVDLSLYPAMFILLTGKNGSGKTTLLKILAGLEKPEKAEIELSGKS
ncbi:MAG: ATP-binding cassette domain-containing protein, partial [SAR324 cluster bacterium]|nr:ATP-binding cassette domain-containing protein [SAR324 cluster bacterium]